MRAGAPALPALALALALACARSARGDSFVAYKLEDYQEEGGRMDVMTQGLTANEDFSPGVSAALTLINDAISGASPTGVPAPAGSGQVPLAPVSDHRKFWEGDFTCTVLGSALTAGVSESREHDYVSWGWSLGSRTEFNGKNTALTLGVAGHDDSVETFYDPGRLYAGKQAESAIAGLTQVLGRLTFVTVDATWTRETGYLDDQYKLVQKTEELVPGSFFPLTFAENRPSMRDSGTLLTGVNRSFPLARGALEATARGYGDTYGVRAASLELRWIQKLGSRLSVAPEARVYRQSAASFYFYDLDDTAIVPSVVPDPSGTHYSSDYRLSAFDATTVGLRAVWKAGGGFQVEVGFDRYAMRGTDGVTPGSAYPVANITTVGARYSW